MRWNLNNTLSITPKCQREQNIRIKLACHSDLPYIIYSKITVGRIVLFCIYLFIFTSTYRTCTKIIHNLYLFEELLFVSEFSKQFFFLAPAKSHKKTSIGFLFHDIYTFYENLKLRRVFFCFCLVIVSTKNNGEIQTDYFNVKSLGNMSSSKTLVLAVDQRKPGATMTLYVNCEHFGTLHPAKTLRELYFDMKDPELQMVSLCEV